MWQTKMEQRAEGVAQVVEHLPSKGQTLSSNFSVCRKVGGVYRHNSNFAPQISPLKATKDLSR
jgi:hypothetical protein